MCKKLKRFIEFNCNPVLGNSIYMADVEAHVYDDTLYLYGTSSGGVKVISTKDMVEFFDHSIVISPKDVKWKKTNQIWAPDCVYRNGSYYLYYSLPSGECGVAKSDKPDGAFIDVGQIKGVYGIDPAVLIDGGQAYIYYGQTDDICVAKLNDDMVSIDVNSIVHPLNVKEHGYHEGISVRKIKNKYYLIYTDTNRHGNIPVCQGYSVSDYPTHGFEYKGILIDNFGCDPHSWNNHGSIEEINGKWYIFYHCATNNSNSKRQLFIEELKTDDNNNFLESKMTSSGIYGSISAEKNIPASVACYLRGNVIKSKNVNSKYQMTLNRICEGDTAVYKYIKFNGENTFSIQIKSKQSGRVELYIDNVYHGCTFFDKADDFTAFYSKISPMFGKKTVELRFFGKAGYNNVEFLKNACLEEIFFKNS